MAKQLPNNIMKHLFFGWALSALLLTGCAESDDGVELRSATETRSEVPLMQVFKSPSCGCCGKWVQHIQTAGFATEVTDTDDLNTIKTQYGIAAQYQSCHTAVIDGYVFEGHIPATVIQRFLSEKPPHAVGLAVPGMPLGSPGMEVGQRRDDYDVLLLTADGRAEVYQRISASLQTQN